tara:strand:+ start:133 stop:1656 length:1524 start_codon:yes stop_codon:yes gene_type:complete
MSKVLLINPNKWGRGITAIWIASHSSALKSEGHEVSLFDSTFYEDWTVDETSYNTSNEQYRETDYSKFINYSSVPIKEALQEKINEFNPDIIFWSAISSHIHGEGEYVNVQYGYDLLSSVSHNALLVTGGLQVTADAKSMLNIMEDTDFLIRGESELVLTELATRFSDKKNTVHEIRGLSYVNEEGNYVENQPQEIISDMDIFGPYDYSLFDDQTFFRPYNGSVVRAIDFELSRGCIYACEYCVETVIQRYYGFNETSKRGSILKANKYLRNKSAEMIFQEIETLNREKNINFFRCQDTNFLTIKREVLQKLSDLINQSDLDIMLYIETRPEGINHKSIELLMKLKVDGVGMGIELAGDEFREDKLSRYASTEKIINAFKLLKEAGIKRTTYNIIGLPEQDESSILNTIEFNRLLNPDNATIAFYSPYIGTAQQLKSKELGYFDDYEFEVDGQLRTLSKDSLLDSSLLQFYKEKFNYFLKNGLDDLQNIKKEYGLTESEEIPSLSIK